MVNRTKSSRLKDTQNKPVVTTRERDAGRGKKGVRRKGGVIMGLYEITCAKLLKNSKALHNLKNFSLKKKKKKAMSLPVGVRTTAAQAGAGQITREWGPRGPEPSPESLGAPGPGSLTRAEAVVLKTERGLGIPGSWETGSISGETTVSQAW